MSYKEYIKNYDRTAYGAGSDRKKPVDRFSGLDVRKMYDAGHKEYGKSKQEAAQMVLDYANRVKGKTKMGGGTRDALNKLKEIVAKGDKDKGIETRPIKDKPKEVQEAVDEFEKTKLDKPENLTPRMDDVIKTDPSGEPTSNPMLDAITAGDDLNEWYSTKFVPHLEAEANATAHEIGDSSRYFLSKWTFEPPKLGDPKEVFEYYADQIKD